MKSSLPRTGFIAVMVFAAALAWAGGHPPAEGAPQVNIASGALRVKVYLPDAQRGYYRGTRFDWSGVIADLEYMGHHYYAPWYSRVDPGVHDYRYEGAEIVASTCSGVTGPVDEFQTNHHALGFDEAGVGGTFIKIGVGVLRKDSAEYDFVKQYEMVDPGRWTVETRADSVTLTQELADPTTGYGYTYRKTVRLAAGKPRMVLEHRLQNTGRRAIETSVYNHNFLVLDHEPPGPEFSLAFPFPLHSAKPPDRRLAELRGNQIVFLRALADQEVVYAQLSGYGNGPRDNAVRIENHHAGAGMVIRGDRPLSDLGVWSIRSVLAVEPFIAMTIQPGSEFTWNVTYEYYTLGP